MAVMFAVMQVGAVAGSNVAAGVASRRSSAVATLLAASPVALAVVVIPLVMVGSDWSIRATLVGASAGLAGGLGLLVAYRALTGGSIGVVVPMITSVTTVTIAVFGSWLNGPPPVTTWWGAALCVLAVTILSRGGQGVIIDRLATAKDSAVRSLMLSLGAGIGFASFALLISEIESESKLSALVTARAIVLVTAVLAAASLRPWTAALRSAGVAAVVAGTFDGLGNLLLLAALEGLSVVVIGVLAASGPAVTAVLSWFVLSERLTRSQLIGIAVAFVGGFIAVMS